MKFTIQKETWDLKTKSETQIRKEMYFYYDPESIVTVSENGKVLDILRLDELFNKPKNIDHV
jgi:hypothetical protein